MKKVALLVLLAFALVACNRSDNELVDIGYYSTTKMVDTLCKYQPMVTVKKTVTIDGKTEVKEVKDSLVHHIKFFKDFELNKRAFKDGYRVDTQVRKCDCDSSELCSGQLKEIKYSLKPGLKFPVKSMLIKSFGESSAEKTIHFNYEISNILSDIKKEAEISIGKDGRIIYCTLSTTEHLKSGDKYTLEMKMEDIR